MARQIETDLTVDGVVTVDPAALATALSVKEGGVQQWSMSSQGLMNWWDDAGSSVDLSLARSNGDELWLTGAELKVLRLNTSDYAFRSKLPSDGNDRFAIQTDGKMEWGGSGARDCSLYRGFPAELWTDNRWKIRRTNGTDIAFSAERTGDSYHRFEITADGKIIFGDGAAGGAGADTNLYRSAANVLKTDDWFQQAGMKLARKTADEIRDSGNTGDTLTNDAELQFAIAANEVWTVEFMLFYNANATPDIQFTVVGPTGATGGWVAVNSTTDPRALGDDQNFNGSGGEDFVLIKATVENGGTAGTVALQWAQNSNSSNDTILREHSTMIAHRIA